MPGFESGGSSEVEAEVAEAGEPVVIEADEQFTVAPVVAAPAERDWLSSVCPYLQSEDGPYHSNQPEDGHRCAAQDPPGTIPLTFQERFCLNERHERCEMFKYTQEAGVSGAVPAGELPGTTAATGDGSVSLRLGASGGGTGSRRPAIIAAGGIAGVAILVFAIVLLLGSCSGDSGGGLEEPSADPQASQEPLADATEEPTTEPTPAATPTPEPTDTSPEATAAPEGQIEILYEIQQGEALRKISETFGISRRRIQRFNPGLEDIAPADMPGEVIVIPLPPELTLADVEALELPGYRGLAP